MSNETDYRRDSVYFDNDFLMDIRGGENGILFTAEYARLRELLNKPSLISVSTAEVAIEKAFERWKQEPLSHDNMTGIVCLSNQFNLEYHKKYRHREYWRRLHPRDIIFYLYMMGGIQKMIVLPFIWITILSGLFSMFRRNKAPNGILHTSGKILHWLRTETCGWKTISKLNNYILRKRHNMDMVDIFTIYFGKEHPITRDAMELYRDETR